MFNRFSKILVVDDSAVARKIVRGLLYRLDLENVEEAADGRAALAALEARHVALVVSDWDMAPMNGLDLLRAMRNRPLLSRIPFIMATAIAQVKFAEMARDKGATHYLIKPFTLEQLATRIAQIEKLCVA